MQRYAKNEESIKATVSVVDASSGRRDRTPSSTTTSGTPSLQSLRSRFKQQPHLKVPQQMQAVVSGQVSGRRKKVQPGKSTIQFLVKEKVGTSTCVVKGHVEEVLDGVIGGGGLGGVYATMGGKWVDLNSRENVPGRTRCYRCGEPRVDAFPPWKSKGNGKGRKPPAPGGVVPPTVSGKKNRRLCLLEARLVQGSGFPPAPEAPPSEDMVKAVKLLQSVMTPEDFSKSEKKLVVPPRKEVRG